MTDIGVSDFNRCPCFWSDAIGELSAYIPLLVIPYRRHLSVARILPPCITDICDDAAASVQRARELTAQAGDVLAQSNELRIANRIALAACRMNRRVLQETVVACTRDLRASGMALDLVVELVTAAVEGSALDHPASRAEVEAEAAASAQWAIEAWRAA